MKTIKKEFKYNKKGITLIALVITVVVLLILAGISIAMLTGENGIIKQATKAKVQTELKSDEEKIKLAILSSQMENNSSNLDKNNLETILLSNGIKAIVNDNDDGTKTIVFLDSKKVYKLKSDGNIEDTNIDFNSFYVAPTSQDEERNNGVIAIGTDGNPVDMDLWEYYLLSDDTYTLNSEKSYKGNQDVCGYKGNIINGTIEGKIPQYISTDNGKTYKKVSSLYETFIQLNELKTLPAIPNTITDMKWTFWDCQGLKITPIIPSSVINMYGTFDKCNNLELITNIPNNVENLTNTFAHCFYIKECVNIPNSVTNMHQTFYECTSLEKAPVIPNSVTNMFATFCRCTSLEKTPVIPNSVTNMAKTFSKCSNLKVITNIPDKVTNLSYTFFECSSLENINIIIPSSIVNMGRTFHSCTKLSGNIIINATLTGAPIETEYDYSWCFWNSVLGENELIISGTCEKLDELYNSKSENSNIKLLNK